VWDVLWRGRGDNALGFGDHRGRSFGSGDVCHGTGRSAKPQQTGATLERATGHLGGLFLERGDLVTQGIHGFLTAA
jgi:hypothetical protein